MNAPRVDWTHGGPEDGRAILDVAPVLTPDQERTERAFAAWDAALRDPAFVESLRRGQEDIVAGRVRKLADVAPNPDSLRAPDTDREHPVDVIGKPGMAIMWGALAIATAVLLIAYVWTRSQ